MEEQTSILETRRHQMFPKLSAHDFARLKRFGCIKSFPRGTMIMKAGEVAAGLSFVLKGTIDVRQGGAVSHRQPIVQHGPV